MSAACFVARQVFDDRQQHPAGGRDVGLAHAAHGDAVHLLGERHQTRRAARRPFGVSKT